MSIPNIGKFRVVDRPEGMELLIGKSYNERRKRLCELFAVLKVLDRAKTISTTLRELGYKDFKAARSDLRKKGLVFKLNVECVDKDGSILIFTKD